jgi:succinate dehydrogenase/fumarate reductase flavoprotein subunit
MAAVAAASNTGAEVIAVEATDRIGGNAVISTGYLAFVESRMQQENGIADSVVAFLRDASRMYEKVAREYGVIFDEELARRFAAESGATYELLCKSGVRFSRFIRLPQMHTVDRVLALENPAELTKAYLPYFHRPNVKTLYRTRARRLLMTNGKITGVLAEVKNGDHVELRARCGIVLAAGGFQGNSALRRRYQPEYLATAPFLGLATCQGDGHLMGQAVGGDLINMTQISPLVIAGSAFLEEAIGVGRDGRRFHDELGPYDARVAALTAQADQYGWYVFDAHAARTRGHLIAQMPGPVCKAETLHELARIISCDAEGLEATVRSWNEFLACGASSDPDFGRTVFPTGRRAVSVAPYHATPMVLGVNFTSGGFTVTNNMQVVDVFGAPIPKLYAAGDCVGGFNALAEMGGIHINGGLTLGWIAGLSAAKGLDGGFRHNSAGDASESKSIIATMELFARR